MDKKTGDKEQNIADSYSPSTPSPASPISLSSPVPFLSLNLSPSSASSHSPKAQEESTSPTTLCHNLNFELKMVDGEEKNECPPSSSNKSSIPTSGKCKEQQEKDADGISAEDQKEKPTTSTDQAADSKKDSTKRSASCSPAPPAVSDYTEPMDTDSDTTKITDLESSTANQKDKSSPKLTTSECPSSSGSPSSHPTSSSSADQEQPIEIKDEDAKKKECDKEDVKRKSTNGVKMEADSQGVVSKKVKIEIGQSTKQSRPSSTPPANTVKEEKSTTSGLKRTLSEGHEKGPTLKKEGKRIKIDREELEAQLEVKITAKAGSRKIEKIVQQLVEERMRHLESTIFDKHFQELKDRVEKIDCATKHQAAISTLQAKIARLAKKFGEANQASENKRKQEALAAAAAAAAAAVAAAAKTAAVTNNPQAQRVLRRPTVGPKPEVPSERGVPSVGRTSPLSVKQVKKEEELEELKTDMARHISMARKLAEYSEGRCRADIKLRKISTQLESVLYHNCQRTSGNPRPDRYASYIFRYLVPYDVYCDWVAKVNYIGLSGKGALPKNLRRTMRMYIERRFPTLSCDLWREIRDVINEMLRVKRKPEFFRAYDERIGVSF